MLCFDNITYIIWNFLKKFVEPNDFIEFPFTIVADDTETNNC